MSSRYRKVDVGHWIKVSGHLGGQLELKQSQPNVLTVHCRAGLTKAALQRRVMLETGLWQGPYEGMIRKLPKNIRPKIEALAKTYSGVRLPIVPLDFPYMLVATALSQRVSYEPLVVDWCRRIWEKYDGEIDLIARLGQKELREIGTATKFLGCQKS